MPSAAQHVILGKLAEALYTAKYGENAALIEAAAREMGVSARTAHRWLGNGHRVRARKHRADAGDVALTREEAMQISAAIKHGISAHGKRRVPFNEAVDWLRANRMIRAERVDEATGECLPLSLSAIARAMRLYGLDAGTIARPAPVKRLASRHPNHVWEVDASVCVVFYLPQTAKTPEGIQIIDEKKVYKNKPQNVKAIELFRVIRYVMTDHFSGLIRWKYFPHAESGEATCDFLAWGMAKKPDIHADPFHGRPRIVMVDPGATASGKVKRFCRRMGIHLIVNAPGAPRAKGQVENAQNLVETWFESGLLHVQHRVRDFAELNALANKYQLWMNATKVHSRTGMTRFDGWKQITREELVKTAPYERLQKLVTGEEATPKVASDLTVRFDGKRWDVRQVPEVMIGKPVTVCASPFSETGAVAILIGADGRETLVPITEIFEMKGGFASNAGVIGEGYEAMPDTLAEKNRKEIARLSTGAKTLQEAEAIAGKKGFVPFGGQLNPFKEAEEFNLLHLPRAATPMPEALPEIAPRLIPVIRAARQLREAIGEAWRPETFDWLNQKYPEGVPEESLSRLIDRGIPDETPLRVVGGAA